MNYYESEIGPDDWIASDHNADAFEADDVFEKKLRRVFDKVKSDVKDIDGLSPKAPDYATVMATRKREKSHAVSFELKLSKSELALTVGTPGASRFMVAKRLVPSDLEDYRDFLEALSKWNDTDALVPEKDFKDWSAKNPKAVPKPTVYKTYEDMAKKSKPDTEAFLKWAKAQNTYKKVVDELAKTEKLKPADPARVKAIAAVAPALAAYYKSF
jgi:hypothetical protein